jgi:hypothetical protein
MACEHKRLKCTNNVFSCLDCGAMVPNPYVNDQPEGQEEKQAPKRKRKTKGAEKNADH